MEFSPADSKSGALTLHGPDGEVTVRLLPKRALTLAKELIEPAVSAIKVEQWGEGWPG